jgi:uncharacterized protein YnzC (UPF0291/DUF896 family)
LEKKSEIYREFLNRVDAKITEIETLEKRATAEKLTEIEKRCNEALRYISTLKMKTEEDLKKIHVELLKERTQKTDTEIRELEREYEIIRQTTY